MQTDEHRDRRRLYPWLGVLTGLVLVVAAAWAADFIPGDVNDDGVFDIADPTVLRRELAGLGPGIAQLCGNGVLDAGEECDSGVSCSNLGFAFGELDCGAGCVAEVNTCTNDRFEDLGLTVFDHQTGLEWEKKTGSRGSLVSCFFNPDSGGTCADLNDVNNVYNWLNANGEWLSRLNGLTEGFSPATQAGFVGNRDWRIPVLADLQTIVDRSVPGCGVSPFPLCIDSIFGETASDFVVYWSSSSTTSSPTHAWGVTFSNGGVVGSPKTNGKAVRAVRGDGLRPAGKPCHTDARCESGLCEDGVCCDSVCSGLCESCLSASTGSSDGTCAFVKGGTDPDAECVPPDICGGGAVAGACCTPTTCEAAGVECGILDNGCGAPLSCLCPPPEFCNAGICEFPPL